MKVLRHEPLRVAVLLSTLSCALFGCEPVPPVKFSLRLDVDGPGRVVSAPEGIDCGASCEALFVEGTRVTLQARPDADARVRGFTGACAALAARTGTDSIDVNIDDDVRCGVLFEAIPQQVLPTSPLLSVAVVGPGQVVAVGAGVSNTCEADAVCETPFPAGARVTLTATADGDATYVGVSGDCVETDVELQGAELAVRLPTIPNGKASCTVMFFSASDVDYPVRVHVAGQGQVTTSPSGIRCGNGQDACLARFAAGTSMTLLATPAAGWSFAEWGHSCAEAADYGPELPFVLDLGIACSARFVRQVDVDVVGAGSVSVQGEIGSCSTSCTFETDNTTPQLVAAPASGQRFVGWSGDCAGSEPTVVLSTTADNCTATFEPMPRLVRVIVDGQGEVIGDNGQSCDDDCVLEVVGGAPAPTAWTCSPSYFAAGDGCDCGCGQLDPDCESASASVCDYFGTCEDVVPNANFACSGDEVVATLTAAPAEGDVFVGWSGDCAGVALTTEVNDVDDAECTAHFAAGLHTVLTARSRTLEAPPSRVSVAGDQVAVLTPPRMLLGQGVLLNDVVSRPVTAAVTLAASASGDAAFADGSFVIHLERALASPVLLSSHTASISTLVFATNVDNRLVSGDALGRLKVWDTALGLLERTFASQSTSVLAAALTDAWLVSVGDARGVVVTGRDGVEHGVLRDTVNLPGVVRAASCGSFVEGVRCALAAGGVLATYLVPPDGSIALQATVSLPATIVDVAWQGHTPWVVLADGRAGPAQVPFAPVVASGALRIGADALVAVVTSDGVTLIDGSGVRAVHSTRAVDLAAFADNTVIALGAGAPAVRVQDFASHPAVTVLGPTSAPFALQRTATGALYGDGQRVMRVGATGNPELLWTSPEALADIQALSGGLLWTVAANTPHVARVREMPLGDVFRTFTFAAAVHAAAATADGVVVALNNGQVQGVDVGTSQVRFTQTASCSAATPCLVAADVDAQAGSVVLLHEPSTPALTAILPASGVAIASFEAACAGQALAFHAASHLAVLACTDEDRVVIYDTELAALRGDVAIAAPSQVAWDTTGTALLLVADGGLVQLSVTP